MIRAEFAWSLLGALFLLHALAACAAGPEKPRAEGAATPPSGAARGAVPTIWGDAAGSVADPELARACRDAWELYLASDPVHASFLGDARFHGLLADNSPGGEERRIESLRALCARARAIDEKGLAPSDRLTRELLIEIGEDELREHDAGLDPASWNLDPRGGPQADLLSLAADQPVATEAERTALIERWSAMPAYVDQCAANLRRGLANGRVASRNAVVETLEQLDLLLATQLEKNPLVAVTTRVPADAGSSAERLAERVRAVVRDRVLPTFARYRDVVRDEVLPRARDDEHPGVGHLAGGDRYYRARIRSETSLDLAPHAIHEIGLAEVARIRAEIAELGEKVFGTREVAVIQARLRGDPALHFTSAEEVEAKARESLARAEAAVPAAFGILPKAPCEVVPIPAHEAPFTTVAYYRQPAADGSRPGRYYVNTFAPATRTRYEAEVLAFHEAVPGHHLQIAIAQELLGLPQFRRHQGSTAYVEGWALYTERLCDELGLYTSDVDRLGMLSYDAWRASRLVVDTGLHALGWSRQQAIDYMLANTLLAENNVANEVDRYIAWPGQALAYKLGQREILALRAQARAALGERFTLAAFHDRVLENGALSLRALRSSIERWIEEERGG